MKTSLNNIQRPEPQDEFIARGLAARAEAERTGEYFEADEVLRELDQMLAAAEANDVKRSTNKG